MLSQFTFLFSSAMLCSEMLLVPTMISESKADMEKLRRLQRNNQTSGGVRCILAVGCKDILMHTYSMAPHSLLAAESEDTTDIEREPAEVPAVQTDSYRPVAQFTQRQGHSAEVQQTTTKIRHTHTHTFHHMNVEHGLK